MPPQDPTTPPQPTPPAPTPETNPVPSPTPAQPMQGFQPAPMADPGLAQPPAPQPQNFTPPAAPAKKGGSKGVAIAAVVGGVFILALLAVAVLAA